MNRRPEKQREADTRKPRQQLLHLLFACSKDDRAWVESKVREMNVGAPNPLLFSTNPVFSEGAA